MEPEGSLPRLQVPATSPYPEPYQSSTYTPSHVMNILFNIILPSNTWNFQVVSSPQVSPPKHSMHFFSIPYVLHAPPISSSYILSPEQYLVRTADH